MCRQSGRRFEDFTNHSEAIIAADDEVKNDHTALILGSFARLQADRQLPNTPPGPECLQTTIEWSDALPHNHLQLESSWNQSLKHCSD
jgi:hypothetical protein